MSETANILRTLAKSGKVDPERVRALAEEALQKESVLFSVLTVGERSRPAAQSFKEMLGMKLPWHQRVGRLLREGMEVVRPRASVAAIGIGATLGLAGLVKGINALKFDQAVKAMGKDPDIQADPKKAAQIAKVVRRWAPSIAADPEILKGTVKNLMKFPDSYLTYDIAKKLSEAESEYQATHGLLSLLQKRIV